MVFSGTITPGFVGGIHAEATNSSIKLSWTVPTTSAGEVMHVDHYYIKYMTASRKGTESERSIEETVKTELEVSNLDQDTYTLFTIVAELCGRIGPEVCIGISTGKEFCKPIA